MVPTDADSSTLSVFYDLVFLEHDPPVGAFNRPPDDRLAVAEPHPDRPERIANIRHIVEYRTRGPDDLAVGDARLA